MRDLLRPRLWLTCSCSFVSFSFANCWSAGSLWLGVPCQADRQHWILPNEASRDLAPSLWTSLFLTFLFCQEGSELCQHSQPHERPSRLRKEDAYLFQDLSKAAFLLSVHSIKEKKTTQNHGIRSEVTIWLERGSCGPEEQEFIINLDPG